MKSSCHRIAAQRGSDDVGENMRSALDMLGENAGHIKQGPAKLRLQQRSGGKILNGPSNFPMTTLVYHFDRTEKFYIGVNDSDRCAITGESLIPGSATLQAPPSFETEGEEIAVFVSEEMGWTMVARNFWRPPEDRDQPALGNPMTGEFSIIQYHPFGELLKYQGIPRVMEPFIFAMALSGRLAYMQTRVEEIAYLYSRRFDLLDPNVHFYEKLATEDLVFQMKRVIDEVFMNEWIRLEGGGQQFADEHIIKVCQMQDIDNLPAGPTKTHLINMREEDPVFFKALTDLRNSFAHHFPVAVAYGLIGAEHLTINTVHVPRGRLNEMRFIEVYLEDLVKSFNRFMVRTFGEPTTDHLHRAMS